MTLDKIDYKLLWNLDYNARMPLLALAKAIGLSKQNTHYRLQKLINNKVILRFTSLIDIHKLGYLSYRIYFRYKNVNHQKEQEILSYLEQHDHVIWLVSLAGSWDIEATFAARNYIHLNNLLKKIKEDLGQHFSKYNISSSIVNYHFPRDYLIDKKRGLFSPHYYGFEPEIIKLNQLDQEVIQKLSINCRQSNQEIGRKLGVTYHTIKEHIHNLEKQKIIPSHRILINIQATQRQYYKALITLNNPTREEEKSLYAFCASFPFVTYLVEVLGQWQFEIEAEPRNQEEFIHLLRELRNKFPALIAEYEIIQVTKEHKLNYFPMGKTLLYQKE